MANGTDLMMPQPPMMGGMGSAEAMSPEILTPKYNTPHLLEVFEKLKKESFEYRWVWEREWLRDIYYTINRQWIYYHPTRREWIDKRLNKSVPRPVTNKVAEVVQSLRASFGAINIGVVARPLGHGPESVATAEIVGQLAPVIHEEHQMTGVLRECDFWLLVTGNAAIQISWDTDKQSNRVFIPHEQCQQCGAVLPPQVIVEAGQACPVCGGQQFQKATRPDGQAVGEWVAYGRGKTTAMSPFEYAFAPHATRFDDISYIIRMRWRDKAYYEANYPNQVDKMVWEKTPQDRSIQLFKSLALSNDVGTGTQFTFLGGGGQPIVDGMTEYECWIKPTNEFPEGFIIRVAGDRSPLLLESQDEAIPGPFPYKDIEGKPIFPFGHAAFEHIGGRLYGRSAISPIIQKQDQINQLDSLTQMIVQRMANPIWIVPEGAGIDNFTGDPGLVLKWNPNAAGGNAKPERIEGSNIPMTLFSLRNQYIKDLEELAGTYDILKGQRPAGVEAFSALQLLVERSQARFVSAFASRGEMYRKWFSVAIELERTFGPEQRVRAILGPNKGYTFQQFEKTQLQGSVSIHVEDGTNEPKTALGKRAAIEHANQLQLINPQDPEQQYAIMSDLGLSHLIPSLDIHIQSALQIQDAFEKWAVNPQGPPPLIVKPWHKLEIHLNERVKWLNTDRMREMIATRPDLEQIVTLHLQDIQLRMMPPPGMIPPQATTPPQQPQQPQQPEGGIGAGRTMRNSNTNAGSPTIGGPQQPQQPPQ